MFTTVVVLTGGALVFLAVSFRCPSCCLLTSNSFSCTFLLSSVTFINLSNRSVTPLPNTLSFIVVFCNTALPILAAAPHNISFLAFFIAVPDPGTVWSPTLGKVTLEVAPVARANLSVIPRGNSLCVLTCSFPGLITSITVGLVLVPPVAAGLTASAAFITALPTVLAALVAIPVVIAAVVEPEPATLGQ